MSFNNKSVLAMMIAILMAFTVTVPLSMDNNDCGTVSVATENDTDKTISTVETYGSGETFALADEIEFTGIGKVIIGSGATMSIPLSGFNIIANSSNIIYLAEGSNVSIAGNSFSISTALTFGVKGTLTFGPYTTDAVTMKLGIDISEDGQFIINDMVTVYGDGNKEVVISIEKDLSSSNIKLSVSVNAPKASFKDYAEVNDLRGNATVSVTKTEETTTIAIEGSASFGVYEEEYSESTTLKISVKLTLDKGELSYLSVNLDYLGSLAFKYEGYDIAFEKLDAEIRFKIEGKYTTIELLLEGNLSVKNGSDEIVKITNGYFYATLTAADWSTLEEKYLENLSGSVTIKGSYNATIKGVGSFDLKALEATVSYSYNKELKASVISASLKFKSAIFDLEETKETEFSFGTTTLSVDLTYDLTKEGFEGFKKGEVYAAINKAKIDYNGFYLNSSYISADLKAGYDKDGKLYVKLPYLGCYGLMKAEGFDGSFDITVKNVSLTEKDGILSGEVNEVSVNVNSNMTGFKAYVKTTNPLKVSLDTTKSYFNIAMEGKVDVELMIAGNKAVSSFDGKLSCDNDGEFKATLETEKKFTMDLYPFGSPTMHVSSDKCKVVFGNYTISSDAIVSSFEIVSGEVAFSTDSMKDARNSVSSFYVIVDSGAKATFKNFCTAGVIAKDGAKVSGNVYSPYNEDVLYEFSGYSLKMASNPMAWVSLNLDSKDCKINAYNGMKILEQSGSTYWKYSVSKDGSVATLDMSSASSLPLGVDMTERSFELTIDGKKTEKKYGEYVALTAPEEKAGMKFVGFLANGVVYIDTGFYMPARNMTLEYVYTKNIVEEVSGTYEDVEEISYITTNAIKDMPSKGTFSFVYKNVSYELSAENIAKLKASNEGMPFMMRIHEEKNFLDSGVDGTVYTIYMGDKATSKMTDSNHILVPIAYKDMNSYRVAMVGVDHHTLEFVSYEVVDYDGGKAIKFDATFGDYIVCKIDSGSSSGGSSNNILIYVGVAIAVIAIIAVCAYFFVVKKKNN